MADEEDEERVPDVSELSELGRAAVEYVEQGFGVFPVAAKGKKPVTPHGLNDWTDNPDTIKKWWFRHPNDNIGIACGTPSNGLLVLDFDVDEEKDKDGAATLAEWERAHGELPETAVAITGGGGMHYLYRTDRTNIRPSVNHELGVDVRSDGSYIVAPPSVHPSGRRYEWQDPPDETPIATATGPVYDFLDHIQRNGGQDETKKENGKFKLPDVIKKGERDNTLFRWASHLRGIGRSDEEIMAAVAGVNALRCQPPMDSKDVERIVRSACRYEQREDESDERTVGRPGVEVGGIRGPRGGLLTNKVAQLIMQRNHARFIDGAPAVWTGRRWDFGKRAFNRCTLDVADDAKQQDKNEVYSYIMDRAPSTSSGTSFDGRYYVQFSNCTYDVLADEIVEPRPEMYIIATLPVELDMDVEPNEADAFIASVANGDERIRTALCEVIGACMCSKRCISQSPMLIGRAGGSAGKASNGKSTYINWIRAIVGTDNVSSMDIATLGKNFQTGGVVGKLANLGDDIPDSFLKGDELAIFKKVVTGEAIHTDVKFADGFDFRPSATFVFSMNAVPRLADTTDGVFRRLYFLPFKRRFSPDDADFDPNISEKLAKPEVLRRGALLGLMALGDLIRRGFLIPIPEMEEEVEEVKQDNDSVARWLYENDIEPRELDERPIADVYRLYTDWCKDAGERNPFRQNSFTRKVKESSYFQKSHGVTIGSKQKKVGGKNYRVFNIERPAS